MVKEMTGDLLRDGKGILCHQVNYHGVMGAGIAHSIATKLLTPAQYRGYGEYCSVYGCGALGSVYWIDCEDGRHVANMFSQEERADDPCATNYTAMGACFWKVRTRALANKLPVYIPARIGCGIAGGDWEKVKGIIHATFDNSPVEAVIVYWEREQVDDPEDIPLF